MYGIERQEKILSLLSENVSISVAKLSKLLYVSQPTVRRDLNELERQKKVIRTHGGVVIRNTPCFAPPAIKGGFCYRGSNKKRPR